MTILGQAANPPVDADAHRRGSEPRWSPVTLVQYASAFLGASQRLLVPVDDSQHHARKS